MMFNVTCRLARGSGRRAQGACPWVCFLPNEGDPVQKLLGLVREIDQLTQPGLMGCLPIQLCTQTLLAG